jgi:hypothetical protein
MAQVEKIKKMPNEPANDDLEKEVYEHLWKGRMGADVSKPIYFSYDELLEVARHFAAWQKEQMMKDAVDGCCISNGKEVGSAINSPIGMVFLKYNKFNVGDKVKVIIIKEE